MDRVDKSEFVARILADRNRFDRVLESVPPRLLTEPILPGGWSVKDVLAHIEWGEREAIGMVRARRLVGSDLWELSEDARNAIVVRESRSRRLPEVMVAYRETLEEFLAALGELSEEELNEPTRFEGLGDRLPGWLPWRVLYDPGHYDDHGATIAAALEGHRAATASRE